MKILILLTAVLLCVVLLYMEVKKLQKEVKESIKFVNNSVCENNKSVSQDIQNKLTQCIGKIREIGDKNIHQMNRIIFLNNEKVTRVNNYTEDLEDSEANTDINFDLSDVQPITHHAQEKSQYFMSEPSNDAMSGCENSKCENLNCNGSSCIQSNQEAIREDHIEQCENDCEQVSSVNIRVSELDENNEEEVIEEVNETDNNVNIQHNLEQSGLDDMSLPMYQSRKRQSDEFASELEQLDNEEEEEVDVNVKVMVEADAEVKVEVNVNDPVNKITVTNNDALMANLQRLEEIHNAVTDAVNEVTDTNMTNNLQQLEEFEENSYSEDESNSLTDSEKNNDVEKEEILEEILETKSNESNKSGVFLKIDHESNVSDYASADTSDALSPPNTELQNLTLTTLKHVNQYNFVALKKISRTLGLALSFKDKKKRKQYNKAQLYKNIKKTLKTRNIATI